MPNAKRISNEPAKTTKRARKRPRLAESQSSIGQQKKITSFSCRSNALEISILFK